MTSEEDYLNPVGHHDILGSFTLSVTETNVEHNHWHAYPHHQSLMHKMMEGEDVQFMAVMLEGMECIIGDHQAH